MGWNLFFAVLGLGASAAAANQQRKAGDEQRKAGEEQKKAAELNAYNIETERVVSKAESLQRHNDRLEEYRNNLSANIAAFSKMNRDVRLDRSVGAFLENQKMIATDDTRRSDFMGWAEQSRMGIEALVTRAEGRAAERAGIAAQRASRVSAFTTLASGLMGFAKVR